MHSGMSQLHTCTLTWLLLSLQLLTRDFNLGQVLRYIGEESAAYIPFTSGCTLLYIGLYLNILFTCDTNMLYITNVINHMLKAYDSTSFQTVLQSRPHQVIWGMNSCEQSCDSTRSTKAIYNTFYSQIVCYITLVTALSD